MRRAGRREAEPRRATKRVPRAGAHAGRPVELSHGYLDVEAMIWDVFEGHHLFYGEDPSGKGYMTRAHLAEVVGLLGPPAVDLLGRGARSGEFFSEDGKLFCFSFSLPHPVFLFSFFCLIPLTQEQANLTLTVW